MDKVRAAFLGMGTMGTRHAEILHQRSDVEIVGLCARPIDDAVKFNAQYGTDYPVYEDFYEMLDKVEMDALYVCLPPFCHDGQIEAAAAKGIAIFTEKPLARDLERAASIHDAVKAAGVKSQMGYHMRFGKGVRMLKKLMDEGKTGKPTLYCANYECNSLHVPWWIHRELCGGQIFEQIIHLYDMAYYLMGNVDSVTGFVANICHKDVPGYTIEDTSSVAIRFANGTLGCITGSNCAVPNRWAGIFKVVFENCVAEFTDYDHGKITWTQPEVKEEMINFDCNPYAEEDDYFIRLVRGEVSEISPIWQGLEGLKIVSGAVESSENDGKPVKL